MQTEPRRTVRQVPYDSPRRLSLQASSLDAVSKCLILRIISSHSLVSTHARTPSPSASESRECETDATTKTDKRRSEDRTEPCDQGSSAAQAHSNVT